MFWGSGSGRNPQVTDNTAVRYKNMAIPWRATSTPPTQPTSIVPPPPPLFNYVMIITSRKNTTKINHKPETPTWPGAVSLCESRRFSPDFVTTSEWKQNRNKPYCNSSSSSQPSPKTWKNRITFFHWNLTTTQLESTNHTHRLTWRKTTNVPFNAPSFVFTQQLSKNLLPPKNTPTVCHNTVYYSTKRSKPTNKMC
jgi:hypothetical protein